MANTLSSTLLEYLVCPIDNEELLYLEDKQVLYNPRLKKAYEIKDSIPIMLVDKAIDVDEATHKQYMTSDFKITGKNKE